MMDDTYRILPARPGDPFGGRVIGPDGEVKGVKRIEYVHDAGSLPEIHITLYAEQAATLTANRERVIIDAGLDRESREMSEAESAQADVTPTKPKKMFKVEGFNPDVETGGES